MKYFKIKDDKFSRLGYGCMRFPVIDGDNSKIDEEKAEEQLLYGIKNGINYIDTAYVYHVKTREDFVGRFVDKHILRGGLYLVTKIPCWMVEKYEDFDNFLNL